MEKISLKEINIQNLMDIINLKVKDHQKALVAPNSVSIAQAHYIKNTWYKAIYYNETPIGFVMLNDDPKKDENHHYNLWRLMIDQNYQGKGYGEKALHLVLKFVRQESNQKHISLCVHPQEGGAEDFYKKFGFKDTGKIIEGEKVYKLTF